MVNKDKKYWSKSQKHPSWKARLCLLLTFWVSDFSYAKKEKKYLPLSQANIKKRRSMNFFAKKIHYCTDVEMPPPIWLFGSFCEISQWVTLFSLSLFFFFHNRETWSHIIHGSTLVSLDNLADCYWNWWVLPISRVDTQGCQQLPPVAQKPTLQQPWDWATWPQEQPERREGQVKPKCKPGISTSALSQWAHFPCSLCFH